LAGDELSLPQVIDREWKDARGVPLLERFRKTFRGGISDAHGSIAGTISIGDTELLL
jgi:hypothetical protein